MSDPEPLTKITTDTQHTWQSDSSYSSTGSSASRYGLNDKDNSPILVYRWGAGISTTSQEDLCKELNDAPNRGRSRVTRLPIPRYAPTLEVKRHHLYNEEEKREYQKYPNYESSLAEIRVPSHVFWGRLVRGMYSELFIISPESSPQTSPDGSVVSHDSQKPTPSSTWSNHDAEPGAADHN